MGQLDQPGIRLASVHTLKGVEFKQVIVAGFNTASLTLQFAMSDADDQITRRDADSMLQSTE